MLRAPPHVGDADPNWVLYADLVQMFGEEKAWQMRFDCRSRQLSTNHDLWSYELATRAVEGGGGASCGQGRARQELGMSSAERAAFDARMAAARAAMLRGGDC